MASCSLLWMYYAWTARWNNGFCTDSPEFLLEMIKYGGAAFSIGLISGIFLYERNWLNKSNYVFQILLRYGLAYFFISYALSLLLDIRYPESYASLEYRLSELGPQDFVWAFFSYTYGYQSFIGWIQLIGACLLFFRFTFPLGFIFLLGINMNVFAIEKAYGLCHIPEVSIYLVSLILLFIPYLRNFLSVTVFNHPTNRIDFAFIDPDSHGYKAINILKFTMVVGIMIFYFQQTTRYTRYYLSNSESPIVGVWKVDSIKYNASENQLESKIALEKFQNIYLDRKRYGSVKAGDSLSVFEYMIDTTFHQLEFWNFHEFRSLDLKGKYSLISPDTLIYRGSNQKDSLEMKLVLDKNYPRLR